MRATHLRSSAALSGARVRRLLALFAVALAVPLIALLAGAAHADEVPEFVIIVHPTNPKRSVDRRFLMKAFLKEVSRWPNDEQIHPVDQARDASVRNRFSERILGRSVAAVRSYWQQRIFSGRGVPPPEVDSDEQVVRFVLGRPGAVGYVSGRADIGKARAVVVEGG